MGEPYVPEFMDNAVNETIRKMDREGKWPPTEDESIRMRGESVSGFNRMVLLMTVLFIAAGWWGEWRLLWILPLLLINLARHALRISGVTELNRRAAIARGPVDGA